MKPLLMLYACLLCLISHLTAQDLLPSSEPVPKKLIPSSANVRLNSGEITKGWLYQLNDSQLVVLHAKKSRLKKLTEAGYDPGSHTSIMAVDQIRSISVIRKNSGLRGVLLGLAAGMLTGVIMGYAEGDDPIMQYDPSTDTFFQGLAASLNNAFAMTAGEKALAYGSFFGICGGITGGIIGAVARKKFIIGGRKEKFHDLQEDLMRRLVVR